MPKARISDVMVKLRLVLAIFMIHCSAVSGETPSFQDVVSTAKQAKMQEYSKSLMDAYKSQPTVEVIQKSGGKSSENPTSPVPGPIVVADPVLRAIYGVNQVLEAEVIYDGVSHSIYSDDARIEVGPWNFAHVFADGVLLTKSPIAATQTSAIASLVEKDKARLVSCKYLELKKTGCLVLLASKASSGVVTVANSSGSRGNASATGPVPPPLPSR